MKVEERIVRSIANRPGTVVVRAELASLGSCAQVTRAITSLLEKGRLVRVSRGAFAKTRINQFTGQPAPAGTLESIAAELFKKLGVEVQPGRLAREYNEGVTTQVPMGAIVNTGPRNISRRVSVGGRSLVYERNSG